MSRPRFVRVIMNQVEIIADLIEAEEDDPGGHPRRRQKIANHLARAHELLEAVRLTAGIDCAGGAR